MYEVGDLIVYGRTGICEVTEITTLKMDGVPKDKLYYILRPVREKRGKVFTPVDNEKIVMRKVISKEEAEGGFVPERDQFYFEMKQGDYVFMVGFKELLICLRLLEKMDEIPEIGEKWWQQMATLYGNDIYMLKYDEAK